MDTLLGVDENVLALGVVIVGAAAAYFLFFREERRPEPISFAAVGGGAGGAAPALSRATMSTSSRRTGGASTRTASAPAGGGGGGGSAHRLVVLYGSQTGTAEEFAQVLVREARAHKLSADAIDLDEFDYAGGELAAARAVLLVMATYGEGEPTDNAAAFMEWLASDAASDDEYADTHFAVFGCGNKTYEHYNSVAKTVDARLAELGATRCHAIGLGDDDASLEEDFASWKDALWPPVCHVFGIDAAAAAAGGAGAAPRCRVVHYNVVEGGGGGGGRGGTGATRDDARRIDARDVMVGIGRSGRARMRTARVRQHRDGESPLPQAYDLKNPAWAVLTRNDELHGAASTRSCRHVEIAVGALRYEPGDHLGVYAENAQRDVDALLARLCRADGGGGGGGKGKGKGKGNGGGSDDKPAAAAAPAAAVVVADVRADDCVALVDGDDASRVVLGPAPVRVLLARHIDIMAPPRQAVLAALVQYTHDDDEKKKMERLGKDAQHYSEFVKTPLRTLLEILDHFKTCRPPLAHVLELLPRLAPRYYSISSSQRAHPAHAHVTAVLTQFTTPTGREHTGVCTGWLARVAAEQDVAVQVYVRKSGFRLPPSLKTPVVMVGPGTGLAPFRAFLQERQALAGDAGAGGGGGGGDAILYFGCRRRDHDFIYEDELLGFARDKVLSSLHLAFSREDENKKVYVQDVMRRDTNAAELYDALVVRGGYLYVCGDARQMAKDVHAAVAAIVDAGGKEKGKEKGAGGGGGGGGAGAGGGATGAAAAVTSGAKFLEKLSKDGRYHKDVWF